MLGWKAKLSIYRSICSHEVWVVSERITCIQAVKVRSLWVVGLKAFEMVRNMEIQGRLKAEMLLLGVKHPMAIALWWHLLEFLQVHPIGKTPWQICHLALECLEIPRMVTCTNRDEINLITHSVWHSKGGYIKFDAHRQEWLPVALCGVSQ